jgi:hypothetical protein
MIKTVSLKLAKQLKAAGFPQRSEFSWVGFTEIGAKLVQYPYPTDVTYAAPTAEEILKRLPRLSPVPYVGC